MSAFIIVVEEQRKRFSKYDVPVVVLHNYPLRSIVPAATSLDATRFARSSVLYLGDVTEARGIWVLMEAFRSVAAELPGAELYLIGRVNEGTLRQRLREWIDRYELESQVKIVGFISHDRLGTYLDRASVGVVPYQNVSQYYWGTSDEALRVHGVCRSVCRVGPAWSA